MTILTPPRVTDFGASTLPKIIEPWSANPTGEARSLAAESGRGLDFSPRLAQAVAASPDITATDITSVSAQLVSAPPAETLQASPEKQFRVFTLIDPNRLWVMVVAIALLGGILAASLVSSFTSVYAMAAWVGLPPEVQWLPVVILDVAIVGFSWALMVFSTRAADEEQRAKDSLRAGVTSGSDREKTGRTRLLLIWVTLFSVVANFMHTYDYWGGDLSTPQAITGAVFSASIPLMALGATEELIRLVFIRRKRVNIGESA